MNAKRKYIRCALGEAIRRWEQTCPANAEHVVRNWWPGLTDSTQVRFAEWRKPTSWLATELDDAEPDGIWFGASVEIIRPSHSGSIVPRFFPIRFWEIHLAAA